MDDGPNPDLELGRYLGQHDFAGVPPLLGSLEVTRGSHSRATLAMVQGYVHHEGNLWEATREAVVAFLHDVEAETEAPDVDAGGRGFLLRLSQREAPAAAVRLMGPSLVVAEILGRRVGEMHRLLAAADPNDPGMAPEALTPFHIRSLYQSIRGRVHAAREALEARRSSPEPREAAAAQASLAVLPHVDALLGALRDLRSDGKRIRVHGDLHLGHVLDTGNDVVFLDFEGDLGQPLSERRLKRPPLADLASLVRSIHFAAHWPRMERELLAAEQGARSSMSAWSRFWFQWMAAACIKGYRTASDGAGLAALRRHGLVDHVREPARGAGLR